MLKKDQLQQIEERYKITGLVAAHEADTETDITLPDAVHVLTDDDLTRIKNTEYKKGKETGVEMDIKAFKEEQGLDFPGKNLAALKDAIAKKAVDDAKIAPDKKVEQLNKDLDTIRAEYDTLKATVQTKDAEVSKAQTDRELYRNIPSLGENAPEVSLVWEMMRMRGYDAKIEDGQLVPYKNGEPIKDNLAKVIPIKDVVTGFAKEVKLITDAAPTPAGRGGGDSSAPIYTKLSELKESFKAQGKSENGQEFMAKALELQKANENFDMNS
jgi:hypothetical protein